MVDINYNFIYGVVGWLPVSYYFVDKVTIIINANYFALFNPEFEKISRVIIYFLKH